MKDRVSISFRLVFAISLVCSASAYAGTEKILHSFNGTLVHGSTPESALISDASGDLYGTTYSGGANSLGTVFKLTPNSKGGWTQTVLYSFKGGSDGYFPTASLVLDALGNLYGTTSSGGTGSCNVGGESYACGTVFKLAPATHGSWTESVIYSFQGGNDGEGPVAGLIFDSAGNLYGTTVAGGGTPFSYGTIFKLTPSSSGSWTESILHGFTGSSDGSNPTASLVFDASGNLYGTTEYGGSSSNGIVFELSLNTQGTWSESVLYTFTGGADGGYPKAPLIFDSAGDLYSTTTRGGSTNSCGTVFELKPLGSGVWSESVLHNFGSTTGDGSYPGSGLTFDQAGNLYGTTAFGGGANCYDAAGSGVVFQLAPGSSGQWTESILYNFSPNTFAGNPYGGVIFQGGIIYGTTAYGGLANIGAVFKLSQSTGGTWTEKTIYSFLGNDGTSPAGNLLADSAGNFYGATCGGGLYNSGTAFKLSPKSGGGWTSNLIYSFKNVPDGACPKGGLVFDTSGNLYGTTGSGGTGVCTNSPGCGTVFELSPAAGGKWTETVLHSFTGGSDGEFPLVGLAFSQENLLGTTLGGGGTGSGCYPYNGCGVVFELTPASGGKWKETIVHTFTGGSDGGIPGYGVLSPSESGNLYGSTLYTGCDGCLNDFPTVFEISPNGSEGWTFTTLYVFVDFAQPVGGLVFDKAGNIYGTTNGSSYFSSWGSVFELTHSSGTWSQSVLYSFSGGSGGKYPVGGVTFDAAGNLYGTTGQGGNSSCGNFEGCGVVYKLVPGSSGSWSFSVLHAFNGYPTDGAIPNAGVTIDSLGNLYGTTLNGGVYGSPNGYGTVYEVTP